MRKLLLITALLSFSAVPWAQQVTNGDGSYNRIDNQYDIGQQHTYDYTAKNAGVHNSPITSSAHGGGATVGPVSHALNGGTHTLTGGAQTLTGGAHTSTLHGGAQNQTLRGGNQRQGIQNSGNSRNQLRGGDQSLIGGAHTSSNSLTGNSSQIGDINITVPGMNAETARALGQPNVTSVDARTTDAGTTINDAGVQVIDNSQYDAQKRNPVATAFAAPLVATEDTCMGSTSVGGQGITLGLSMASTWKDGDCVRRKDARFLHNAGYGLVALATMCEKDNIREAVARAGSIQEKLACGITREDEVAATTSVKRHHRTAAVANDGQHGWIH